MAYTPVLFPALATWGFWGGGAVLLMGLGLTIYGLAPIKQQGAPLAGDKKIGDISVSMGDANNVNHIGHIVNEAPAPDIEFVGKPMITEHSDGTFTVVFSFEVVAPYPPGQLYLKVSSAGISELDVSQQAAGVSMSGHSGRREGYCFTTLMRPYGRYQVRLRSRDRNIHVEHTFS